MNKVNYKVTRVYPFAEIADFTIFTNLKEAEAYAKLQRNYGYFFVKIEAC